jgi:hypothetical protein
MATADSDVSKVVVWRRFWKRAIEADRVPHSKQLAV